MNRRGFVAVLLLIQLLCAVFFIQDIVASVLGLRATPMSWQLREMLQLGAALGLVLGAVLGAVALHRARSERNLAREGLRRANTAFMDLLSERFADWGLTPAEQDVALFAIKGMSTAEIAALRSTSEGTVKAQCNAIYRKAGVSGRPQLLGLFIDDLMGEPALPARGGSASPGPVVPAAKPADHTGSAA